MRKIFLFIPVLLFVSCSGTTSSEEAAKEILKDSSKQEVVEEQSKEIPKEIEMQDIEVRSSKGEFYAYFADPDTKNPTNIRNAPGGEIVYKVPVEEREYFSFKVVECSGKWFRIEGGLESYIPDEGVENVELSGDCWVHSSVIGATLVGGINNAVVRKMPDENSEIVSNLSHPTDIFLEFLDMKNDWVKIEFTTEDNQTTRGWIPASWICSNPLTTCV